MVVLDSVRADRLPPYPVAGSSLPAITAFASGAAVYERAYAGSNWTGSSFATILTGRLPFEHRLLGVGDSLSDEFQTLPGVLSDSGYETAAYFAGAAGSFGFERGFGRFEVGPDTVPLSAFSDEALGWVAGLSPEKDFFLLLHGYDAHRPYDCSPGTAPWSQGSGFDFYSYYNGDLPADPALSGLDIATWERFRSYRGQKALIPALARAYDACVARLDGAVGRLLSGLEAKGSRPLLAIITADHGEFLGEHGRIDHGWAFYEQVARVPLIIKFPGRRPRPRRKAAIAGHCDLLPTICAATGANCPSGLPGSDLASERAGKIAWASASGVKREKGPLVGSAAYVEGDLKLLYFRQRWQLFDLAADPGETRSLAKERPADFLRLATGYLKYSGAAKIVSAAESIAAGASCFREGGGPIAQAAGGPCGRALAAALSLARSGAAKAAEAALNGADCTGPELDRGRRLISLSAEAAAGARKPDYAGVEASLLPGIWEVAVSSFVAGYSDETGVVCRDAAGRRSTDKSCLKPVTALLDCVEKTRFAASKTAPAPSVRLEEALRKSGYIQ